MGTVMAVRIITTIVLGPVAGTVVDRSDRRRLMIAMDFLRVALVGGVAYLVAADSTSFPLILVLTGVISVCSQFFNPAFQASLINVVAKDDVTQASSMLQVGGTLGMVVGPLLGGMVVGFAGGEAALTVDAISFLVSAVLILIGGRFASPFRPATAATSFFVEMREGFAFIAGQPVIRSVAIIAPVINFFGNAIGGVLMPVLAVKVWLASPTEFGALESVFPLGFAVGAGLVMAFSKRMRRRGLLMFLSMLVASVLFTVVPLLPSVRAAMPFSLVAGMALAVPNVLLQVLVQSEAPAAVQGRIFGVMGSLLSVTTPAAFLLAGRLADLLSPVTVAVAAGVLLILSVLTSMGLSPVLRNHD